MAVSLACLAVRQGIRGHDDGVGVWHKPRRERGYIRRNAITGRVELVVAAKPLKVIACSSLRAGQTVGRRRGKFAAVFHDDPNAALIAQLAAAKVKGNVLQSVRTYRAMVQNLKDGAETDLRVLARSVAVATEAARIVPANRTAPRQSDHRILSTRKNPVPVFDISVVLVQQPVPYATVFHNDLNILEAITQLAAAKVKGNGLQSVRVQCAGVQDFKDGAETDRRAGALGPAGGPVAGRIRPTMHTGRPRRARNILPPRMHPAPVFDISVVLIQYSVPFVALGRAAFGLARACTTTSRRRRTQRIAHAAGGVVFAENQICGVQVIPANRMRYGIVRHEQAVGILVLLCILLCGCHLRRELVGVHCPSIGKGHIAHCFVRQSIVHRAGDAHCREVKVIGAAGGKGELLVDFTRREGRCRQQRQHHAA